MKKIDKIIEKLKELKPEIEKRYKVTEIGVFGSYLRDEQTENSDIDILIDYERGMTLFSFCELENWLSDILENKVDLVMKKSLKPRIGKRILSEVVYL
jgi:uncharacterized protein